MMTRKDYRAIARIIEDALAKQSRKELSEPIRFIADNIASYLAVDNPRFDMDKFFVACGLK